MKGLVILGVLLLAIAGSLYLLTRPSDVDLRRIEDEIGEQLRGGDATLTETTRLLNALRSIKPTIQVLDRDLNALREEGRALSGRLEQLRVERPEESQFRGTFLDVRRDVRQNAANYRIRCVDLQARSRIVDRFVRETEPRVKMMISSFAALFQLKNQREAAGQTIDEAVLVKIDYLQTEIQRKQALARSVFEVGSVNAEQGATLNETASREIALLIADVNAMHRRLQDG